MEKFLDGELFVRLFSSAAASVGNALQEVNELNVFPVPDGDTGTNMSMTMDAGLREMGGGHPQIGQAAAAAAQGLLRGARGNSGVILSLLFRGFAKHLKDAESADGRAFAAAMTDGVDTAYRAVMKPTEGTMLTVSRVAAKAALDFAEENPDFEAVLAVMSEQADLALKETIHQNPVLAKAGVVDAGGYGLCLIFSGMLSALRGNPVLPAGGAVSKGAANFSDFETEDIEFGYCTEFIVKRERGSSKDPAQLRAFLGSVGDSLVFVEDEAIIKVHVHTNDPGKAVSRALGYGSLTAIKIENMREQHTEQVVKQSEPEVSEGPPEEYGFVGVCAGEGLSAILKDLGVTAVVEGGQTMNPSTQDIANAARKVSAKTVFVLPNNKNIIMAAEQAVPLIEGKTLVVLPSRDFPQGVMAMLAFDPNADAERNRANMIESMKRVSSAQVTFAARNSNFDGYAINEGDCMALLDGALVCADPDGSAVLGALADKLAAKDPENITLYYGEGATEADAENAAKIFGEKAPTCDVQVIFGGQPVYRYIVSAE